MRKVTLCYPRQDGRILMGIKKRKIGAGKWNGFGGGIEEGESPAQAAVRELEEECGLIAKEKDLRQVAFVRFYIGGVLKSECYFFVADTWQGEPKETEEMGPLAWHLCETILSGDIPMLAADKYLLRFIMDGITFEAEVEYDADMSAMLGLNLKPVKFEGGPPA